MTKKLRIALAQLNFTVGDIEGNVVKHLKAASTARDELAADILIFPELSLTGYPAEDLLLRKAFIDAAEKAFQRLLTEINNIYCVIGHPHPTLHGLQNACSVIYNGSVIACYAKQRLPNYGVFDEARYFVPGNQSCVFHINEIPVGLVICEDLWSPSAVKKAAKQGARIIISPNASPFEIDKHEQRVSVLNKRIKASHVPIVYVNHVSGQDDLIFDGGSMVLDETGKLCQLAGFFNEKIVPVDLNIDANQIQINTTSFVLPNKITRIYQALVLAVRDYIEKNCFPGVLIGLSGGIDSALVLAIAVDALGKDRVRAIIMPSRYTTEMSIEDATALANNLGVKTEIISIELAYNSFLESLAPSFANKKTDMTEENIQARCRAILLMALSNKFGDLVLTTGNRSEIAVGYCTLYGDMAGGFAVLKDIPKTLVYELANYRNQITPIIPQRIIDRPPSAELAPNQKDEDSLPPYAILDKILYSYSNESQSIAEIIAQGFDEEVVKKVVSLIRKNEYKRKQLPVGARINHKSFTKDWRYPITNGFKR